MTFKDMESNIRAWIITLLVIAGLATLYFYNSSNPNNQPSSQINRPKQDAALDQNSPPFSESQQSNDKSIDLKNLDFSASPFGSIEGGLSYPGQRIPDDLEVCAVNIENQKLNCTKEHLKGDQFQYGVGYSLSLPPGSYQIYAFTSALTGIKAYYSEYVTCGLKVECPSHEPIIVEVKAGDKLTDINPWDWYNH